MEMHFLVPETPNQQKGGIADDHALGLEEVMGADGAFGELLSDLSFDRNLLVTIKMNSGPHGELRLFATNNGLHRLSIEMTF